MQATAAYADTFAQSRPDGILVATDLSDIDFLVPHAVATARASGSHVMLLHALPPSEMMAEQEMSISYVARVKRLRDLRVELLGVARQFESQGIHCDSAVRNGAPVDVICEELGRGHSNRLMVGARCRGGRSGSEALGPVALDLIAHVDIPVFVVGPDAPIQAACSAA
jgi:nucleotide-binding universal stress UspA family protein